MRVNPEYERLIPRPSADEYGALKESIQQSGIREPVSVNKDGIILDGHTRFKIWKELGKTEDPPSKKLSFDSPEDEQLYVVAANLERRHLNDFQKVELGQVILRIEREKARKRQLLGLASKDAKGKTSEIMASRLGVSARTFERCQVILEEGEEEQKERVRNGSLAITSLYNIIRGIKPKTADPKTLGFLERWDEDQFRFAKASFWFWVNCVENENGTPLSREEVDVMTVNVAEKDEYNFCRCGHYAYQHLGDQSPEFMKFENRNFAYLAPGEGQCDVCCCGRFTWFGWYRVSKKYPERYASNGERQKDVLDERPHLPAGRRCVDVEQNSAILE